MPHNKAICCYLYFQWLWRWFRKDSNRPFCKLLGLILGCRRAPEWTIFSGLDPYNYTHGCTAHVGELLDDSREHRVVPGVI